jgi:ABC-2 type transport system permease protein
MNSLYQLILVHFKTFVREPAIIFWAVLFPILMAWVLGLAFSNQGEITRTVYVVGDVARQELSGIRTFGRNSGAPVRVKFEVHSENEAVRAIKRGIISIYIETQGDSVVYHFDPANAEARLIYLTINQELLKQQHSPSEVKILESIGTRYIDFLIPGLIGLGIMNSCLWGISWNLIETRMKKLLRRMVATPMRKGVFLSSHIVTRILLGGVETLLLITFSWLYFGTEITGSIVAFLLVFLSGIFAFSGIGILTASRTDKSEIGNGLINAVTLTMMVLSGIFFNYHNFPDWAVSFIRFLPLTILVDAIRAIFIEAATTIDVAVPVLILVATGLITFVAGLRIFKWY